MQYKFLTAIFLASSVLSTYHVMANPAKQLIVSMNLVDTQGVSASIGEVTISQGKQGLIFSTNLKSLPAGKHGFHIHENPSCDAKEDKGEILPAKAAGDHYDPKHSKMHSHPHGTGHLGDLPALTVDEQGNSKESITAPRLTMSDVKNRSLMIHAGGDNYSDTPQPLGGGGKRIACGVIISK